MNSHIKIYNDLLITYHGQRIIKYDNYNILDGYRYSESGTCYFLKEIFPKLTKRYQMAVVKNGNVTWKKSIRTDVGTNEEEIKNCILKNPHLMKQYKMDNDVKFEDILLVLD